MNTANWIMLTVYLIGILPAAAWFMWLDRDTLFPAPIGYLFVGIVWPVFVPLALIFIAIANLADFMWWIVTGRKS